MTTIGQLKSDEPIHGDAIDIASGSVVGSSGSQALTSTSFANLTGVVTTVSGSIWIHIIAIFDFSIADADVGDKVAMHFEGRITQDGSVIGKNATYFTAP